MFQIHLFQLFVLPFAAWVQRATRHGGFAPANCSSVCQSGHLQQSMLLTSSLAIFSSDQYTRICQCHQTSVSLIISRRTLQNITHTGKYALRLGFCASRRA